MPAKNAKISLTGKLTIGVFAVTAVAAVAWFGLRDTAIVAPVTIGIAVDAVPGSVVVYADGNLRELKSEMPGKVEWCEPLQPGQGFKKGEVLMRLDTTDLDREIQAVQRNLQVAQQRVALMYANVPAWQEARAKLDAAIAREKGGATNRDIQRLEAELDTIAIQNRPEWINQREALDQVERHHKQGTMSDEQLDRQKRALARVETDLRVNEFDERNRRYEQERQLKNRLIERERMTVKAPSDGVVKETFVWIGALIHGGETIAKVYSNDRIVVAKISEEDISDVKIGQPARVRLLSYPSEEFDAKVTKILPAADENTQRYTVYLEVAIEPQRLIPYSTGEVMITVGTRENRPKIPRRALFNDNFVYVVKGSRIERRQLKLGYVALNEAEVIEGVKPGERLVVEEIDQFRDGQRVRVRELK